MKRKRNKNNLFNYFWRILLKFDKKYLEIHKHRWLSIIWIFKKLNSIQTIIKDIPKIKLIPISLVLQSKTYKKSHSISRTLIALNKFVFYHDNCFFSLRILSYRESTVAAISSLARYMWNFIFFLPVCNTGSIVKSTYSVDCQNLKHKTICGIFVQMCKKPPYFWPLEVIFK